MLDAETIAPVYPHQRLRRSSPMKDRCSGRLRISTSARHCPEAPSFHARQRLLSRTEKRLVSFHRECSPDSGLKTAAPGEIVLAESQPALYS